MPKVNKVLHGSVDEISDKIKLGIQSNGTQIVLRDEWTTEADGRKNILQIYEKLSTDPDARHYSMSLLLFDTGEEVRLYASTSGGSVQYFSTPYISGEGELTGVLNLVLEIMDEMIL